MLLWLTLALLGTSSCWASEMYGPGGGTTFTSSAEDEEDITGMRVCIGALGLLKSIQLRFRNSWSKQQGTPNTGRCEELILQPDGHFIAVQGTYQVFLLSLILYTNHGRVATFGSNQGQEFSSFPDHEDKVLRGVFGQHNLMGITGLGFTWGFFARGEK
ncbi:pancreatic adenocarcinoma up-regulated factor-like [Tenrec ecaudatus]|uniref:pancreatic adenocarcinoma up-regulated factor-like n=1 Tax=Tenrec ecaudatus TaxID=94439 RepID=UPI003F59E130